jgi:hypothetical protein
MVEVQSPEKTIWTARSFSGRKMGSMARELYYLTHTPPSLFL